MKERERREEEEMKPGDIDVEVISEKVEDCVVMEADVVLSLEENKEEDSEMSEVRLKVRSDTLESVKLMVEEADELMRKAEVVNVAFMLNSERSVNEVRMSEPEYTANRVYEI